MSKAMPEQLIIFTLAGKLFGLDVTIVHEILPTMPVRTIPKAAAHLRGLIDFRGQIIPLVNLRSLLLLPEEREVRTVIVIQAAGKSYGLMVDGVKEVMGADDRIVHAGQPTAELGNAYLAGEIQVRGESIAVLDEVALLQSLHEEGGDR